jgi:hypothetical protein
MAVGEGRRGEGGGGVEGNKSAKGTTALRFCLFAANESSAAPSDEDSGLQDSDELRLPGD